MVTRPTPGLRREHRPPVVEKEAGHGHARVAAARVGLRRPVALRVAAGTERLRPEVPGEALEDRLPALLGGPAFPPPGVCAEDEARKDAGGGAGERVVAGDLAWPRVALGPAAQASFAPEGSIV